MKVLAIICGLGLFQATIDSSVGFFKQPRPHLTLFPQKEGAWDDQWDCSRCGHKNYEWTSICGKCGRSR